MEKIVSRDEMYAVAMAAREPAFEALVQSINEEIRKAASNGQTWVKWDAKEHPDILWDTGLADRLEQLLKEAGYETSFSYCGSLFSYYVGCTIDWAKKEPETNKEEPEEPIVEEPKKRKWGRKNK